MALAAPTQAHAFGKYTLVAKLATGGMAEIFLARLQGAAGFEKLVCIKRILPQHAKDKQFVAMFLAEARIAAHISHSNVCQVFELGEIDGRYFIAMEYLEGVPLACFRRKDLYPQLPDPRLVAGLGIQACEGLHHAHQLRRPDGSALEVVHRDVSGNNLFATVDGTVKVLDFGIAKVQDSAARTTTGSVKGTYAYMAPEQLRGERVDRRTDVFAVGIVLWELLAQRHLFRRDTEYLTFDAITNQPIPDICAARPEVPRALGAAIGKALARDRDARFATARELGEAIGQAVLPIGGAMPSSAIAHEIAGAFGARLEEQRQLMRLAHAGGSLSLEEEVGPQVGHGIDLIGTPASIVSGLQQASVISGLESQVVLPPTTLRPITGSSPSAVSQPSSPSAVSQPEPPPWSPPRSYTSLWIAAMIIVAAAAAYLAIYVTRGEEQKKPEPPPVAVNPPIATPPPAPAPPPPTEKPVPVAAPETETKTETEVTPTPPDKPRKETTRKKDRDRDKPDKPSGPPGFITIDSSPVYATIYIDGKKYGETPLVKQELPPGKHTVRAVSPSGAKRTLSITIVSGKTSPTRRIEW